MQVLELIGCKESEIIYASAKTGIGIDKIFSAIIEKKLILQKIGQIKILEP